jgi:TolB protein
MSRLRGGLGLLWVLSIVGTPLRAQEQNPSDVRLGLIYEPGYVPVLVIAPLRSGGTVLDAITAEVGDILGTDLDYSDRFQILPVPDSLLTGGPINYGLWNQLGAVWLVTADVSGTPAAPILRVGVHDVVYGELKNVQAFSLPDPDSDGFRMAVHRASDAVVSWATEGEPGAAATRIAFRRRSADGTSALYVVDSDGRNPRRVSTGASQIYSPAFSPDGGRIAYTVQDDSGNFALMEVNLVTGRRRTLEAGASLYNSPSYAPDGRLAFAKTTGGGREDGPEVFLDGAGQLTRTRGAALNPSFSPDGEWLAFEADPLNQQQIYVQRVSGGSPRMISRYVRNERTNAAGPDWSPTGERIVYSAFVDGVYQIFAVNPDGTDRRMLTSRGRNEDPSWAPDGRHVVFASEQASGRGLMILDTVTGRTRILVSGHVDMLPDWSGSLSAGR